MATGGVVAGDGHLTWVFLGCQRSPLQGAGTTSLFLFQERRGYHRDRTGEGIRHAAGQSDCCAEGWGTGSLRVRPAGAAPSTPAPRGTRGPRVAEGGTLQGLWELPFSFQHHPKPHRLECSKSHSHQAPRKVPAAPICPRCQAISVGLILPGARRAPAPGRSWLELGRPGPRVKNKQSIYAERGARLCLHSRGSG